MFLIAVYILTVIYILLGIIGFVLSFAWKRKDVSFMAQFTFLFKYGLLVNWKRPELYFKDQYAKLARQLHATIVIVALLDVLFAILAIIFHQLQL